MFHELAYAIGRGGPVFLCNLQPPTQSCNVYCGLPIRDSFVPTSEWGVGSVEGLGEGSGQGGYQAAWWKRVRRDLHGSCFQFATRQHPVGAKRHTRRAKGSCDIVRSHFLPDLGQQEPVFPVASRRKNEVLPPPSPPPPILA